MTDDQNILSTAFTKAEDVSPQVQAMLNNPLPQDQPLDPKDQEFLTFVMAKIDSGEIDLYRPSTLINHSVYDKLSEEAQGKADFDAMNLLSTLREIRQLWNAGHRNTYQIENLTHRIRVTKERLEQIAGDIYIL